MRKTICVISISCFTTFAATYVVQKGENLSNILHKLNKKPIYGHEGSIRKVTQINNIENQNLIHPGQKIVIPDTLAEKECIPEFIFIPTAANTLNYSISATIELGSVNFVSRSKSGELNLPMGTNTLYLNFKRSMPEYDTNFFTSANMLKIPEDISFKIQPKNKLLFQAEINIGKKYNSLYINGGVGLQDILGITKTNNTLTISKSLTPYISTSFSKNIYNIDSTLGLKYYLKSERDQLKILGGHQISVELSKKIYKLGNYPISGMIKLQEQNTETGFSKDKDTRGTFGFKIDF